MKKDTVRAVVVAVVALAMYNIVAFMIPFAKTAVFWVSWSFTLAAFVVVGSAIYIAFVQNPNARSRFYGFPIARLAVGYGAVQLVLSFVFMAVGAIATWWVAVVAYTLELGLAMIGLVTTEATREEIQRQDNKLKKDVSAMRAIQSKANQLSAMCSDVEAAAAVKAFAEEVRFSDPVSSEAIADAEADLAALVDELQAAVVDDNAEEIKVLCRKATAALVERNRLCKLNKN